MAADKNRRLKRGSNSNREKATATTTAISGLFSGAFPYNCSRKSSIGMNRIRTGMVGVEGLWLLWGNLFTSFLFDKFGPLKESVQVMNEACKTFTENVYLNT